MRILMAASTAAVLIVSTAAFAGTAPAPQIGQPQLATTHKAAAHRPGRDPVGDRETAALNSLEAAGYFTVKDLGPDGKNIEADAQKPGAALTHLTVMPDGTIQTGNPTT